MGRELLPGWGDSWLIEPREELRLLQMHALESAAQGWLIGGQLPRAAACAQSAVRMDPLRESANRLLLEIYLREGNRADALRQYDSYCETLRREIGLPPGPAIAALLSTLETSMSGPYAESQTSLTRTGFIK